MVGLPRSGTTHLVNLIAADPRLRSLPLWEGHEPVPTPGEPVTRDQADPRHRRCAAAWATMQQTVPLLAAMHPMDPDHVHEELELQLPDFTSYDLEWVARVPAVAGPLPGHRPDARTTSTCAPCSRSSSGTPRGNAGC